MVVEHGFASDQAGYVISIELTGMALATLPANYWLYRVDLAKAVTGLSSADSSSV